MTTTAITPPSPEEVLPRWLEELQASDRARGTIRRYRSAVEGFLAWYSCEEQRPLTFSTLTPLLKSTVRCQMIAAARSSQPCKKFKAMPTQSNPIRMLIEPPS